jgi:hypothetical protein
MGETPSPSPQFVSTVVVSPVGTPSANGAALLAALAGVYAQQAAGTHAPMLIHLEPGTYDVGPTPLMIKGSVDIEGSGEDLTKITGSGPQTITTAVETELRYLTVDHIGDGKGIDYEGGDTLSLAHVTLTAENGVSDVTALYIGGGFVYASDLTMWVGVSGGSASGITCVVGNGPLLSVAELHVHDGRIVVSGDTASVGVTGSGCSLLLDSTSIDATGGAGVVTGVSVQNAIARLSDVVVEAYCANCQKNTALQASGMSNAIHLESWSSQFLAGPGAPINDALEAGGAVIISIADSQLAGAIAKSGTAKLTCVGDYDANYAPVTCP